MAEVVVSTVTGYDHLDAYDERFAPLLNENVSAKLGELYLATGGCKDSTCLELALEVGATWLHPEAAKARGRFIGSTATGFAKGSLEGPAAAYAIARLIRILKHLSALKRASQRLADIVGQKGKILVERVNAGNLPREALTLEQRQAAAKFFREQVATRTKGKFGDAAAEFNRLRADYLDGLTDEVPGRLRDFMIRRGL